MKAQSRAAETEAETASSSKAPSSKPKKRNPLTATPPPPTTRHPGIAAHKRALPPTGPLDATDTLIVTLKGGGHSDKAIAAALVARGLHAYDPKSISTRHRRIREARAAETDRALRLRRRRWTAAEDEALVEAYLGALRRQDDELRKLRRRFYRDVAGAVGERVAGSFFSAAACEERYRELVAEKAVVEGEWGDLEVERREGVKRLTAFWEQECESARREDGAWQDHLVKEVAEEERERRKEERARRGGTAREVRAERKAERRGRGGGARVGRGRGKGRGGKSSAA